MAATDYVIVEGWQNCYLAKKKKPTKKGPQTMSTDRRVIEDGVSKYWQSHGIDDGSWAKFEFHRNKDNEYVCLTACSEISGYALEFLLSCLESNIGQRCTVPDLLRIVREFDKNMRERYE